MDTPITRAEHEEFRRRIDEENKRQDKRIGLLEESTRQIGALTVSVEKLAQSIEVMVKEQERQGQRLEQLEREPAEEHKKNKRAVINCIISAVIGAIVSGVTTWLVTGI